MVLTKSLDVKANIDTLKNTNLNALQIFAFDYI